MVSHKVRCWMKTVWCRDTRDIAGLGQQESEVEDSNPHCISYTIHSIKYGLNSFSFFPALILIFHCRAREKTLQGRESKTKNIHKKNVKVKRKQS